LGRSKGGRFSFNPKSKRGNNSLRENEREKSSGGTLSDVRASGRRQTEGKSSEVQVPVAFKRLCCKQPFGHTTNGRGTEVSGRNENNEQRKVTRTRTVKRKQEKEKNIFEPQEQGEEEKITY